MPVCTRCRAQLAAGLTTCPTCKAPVMSVVRADGGPPEASRAGGPGASRPVSRGMADDVPANAQAVPAVEPAPGDGDDDGEDRMVLLLEEPMPEMAAMIQEFLQNSGIVCVTQSEPIGLLYRLPMLGSAFSGARVFVRASDFVEARELVAHFFKKS